MNNNIFRIENDGIAYVTEKELKSFNVPNGSINEYILQIEGLIAKKLNTDPAQIKANSVTWDFNKSRLDDNSQVLVVKYSYIDEYNTAFIRDAFDKFATNYNGSVDSISYVSGKNSRIAATITLPKRYEAIYDQQYGDVRFREALQSSVKGLNATTVLATVYFK